jgi:hypothetical protein
MIGSNSKEAHMVRLATSSGHEVSEQTARELRLLLLTANMESTGRRYWYQLLGDDDRKLLGGQFAAAFCKHGRAIGLYRELSPRVSFERAMLEVLHELGLLPSPRFRRLVLAIGEQPDQPAEVGTRPRWDAETMTLSYRGEIVRKVSGRASNMLPILNAFERLAWPGRIAISDVKGLAPHKFHQTVFDLNRGLKLIVFENNAGIMWRPRLREPMRRQ